MPGRLSRRVVVPENCVQSSDDRPVEVAKAQGWGGAILVICCTLCSCNMALNGI